MENKILSIIIVLAIVVISAVLFARRIDKNNSQFQTLYVGPVTLECMGEVPQRCLQVKQNEKDEYSLFYGTINGFDFEPGYDYKLNVETTNVANPPADSTSTEYNLVQVVSKEPASYVMITSPQDNQQVSTGESFVVSGEGRGLFEGNVVIAALDQNGNTLFQTFTTMPTQNLGDKGTWQTTVTLPEQIDYLEGRLTAFSPSPAEEESSIFYSLPVIFTNSPSETSAIIDEMNVNNPDLIDVQWNLVEYLTSDGKYSPAYPGAESYITFDETMTSGTTGCNRFTGSYSTDGDAIKFGPLATTKMACEESLGSQEYELINNMGFATYYSIEGNNLILKNDSDVVLNKYTQ